ncbi:hypothetical protein C4C99_RS23415 [Vibrio parahaemolyticus]|uniref:hypothetical protein n=1 Tax=Vibrio parahaemolyticus TaxID=670 RepID=UPI0009B60FF9|nr:hypothetical protein [Vibrio parahaemolyticus]EGQ8062046.1 hypothetical protein [Vibrio parahaemolyticus]EGQ8132850.1 hypothetical protein [Vibrio parahaemolyticus]EGQ8282471.1 hypothetical protein [Vibrio parahaemolyticus]EGQ8720423.1 hypothetical protein [Vibrio parahaemolyticus]EGQ8813805.1 hypothetical protein [Vibrio parahaemolyticus]
MNTKKVTHRVMVGGVPVTAGGEQVVVTLEQALTTADKIEQIPADAKRAVKDFFKENWAEIQDLLTDIDIPLDLLQRFENFADYVELVLRALGLV